MKKVFTILAVLVAAGLIAGGISLWYARASAKHQGAFKMAPVEKGTLTATISATGTVEPTEVVDVGAQVVGPITSFGTDPHDSTKLIDFGSQVEAGTVLANIDPSTYESDVKTAKADLASAKANVLLAQAGLDTARSKLRQTQRDWERVQKLKPTESIADLDYDTAQNAYETAAASVPAAEATLEQAKAAVDKAQATYDKALVNLGYTVIKSPVKGVIVARRVNIGQTIVSSLSTTSLFLVAKDLSKLQVWASVNEADIGQIHPGQPVHFTVDAYPGKTFEGEVGQIRLNATVTQNVVTYTVVVNTDNTKGELFPWESQDRTRLAAAAKGKTDAHYGKTLFPYMTANLQFQVDEHKDSLRVPNAALRWKPQANQVVPDARDAYVQAQLKQANPGAPAADKAPAAGEKEHHSRSGTLWVQDGEFVRPIKVTVGLSDDNFTEVIGPDVKEGMQVVVRENHADAAASTDTTNPFAPKLFGGRR
jgi:HlyD family secretion protein